MVEAKRNETKQNEERYSYYGNTITCCDSLSTMAAYVPYQVDYKVENKAKSLGFSKKKVVFKFGIANNQAIQEGMVGSGCRGSEHEVIFIWSLKSGKRQIIADNKEVHFSESGQNGWTLGSFFPA